MHSNRQRFQSQGFSSRRRVSASRGRTRLERAIAVTALATLGSRCALGANSISDTWTGAAGDFSWDDGANWFQNSIPGTTNSADLIGNITANETITINNPYTLAGISIADGTDATPSFTISGATLTLTGGTVGVNSAGTTVTDSSTAGTVTRTGLWVQQNGGGTYTIADNLNLNSGTSAGSSSILYIGNSSWANLTGILTAPNGQAFSKFGNGTLTVSNPNNVLNAVVYITGGELIVGGNDVGSASVPGVLGETTSAINLGTSNSTSNNIAFFVGGSYTEGRNINVGTLQSSGTIGVAQAGVTANYTGNITLGTGTINGNLYLSSNSANSAVNFTGVIGGTGTNDVIKVDGGTVTLSNANTFPGLFEAHAGVTVIGNNSALGVNAGSVLVGGSASNAASLLTANGVTFGQNVNVLSTSAGYVGATLGGVPTQTSSTWSGNITLQQNTTLTGGNSGTTYFTGNIANGAATAIDPYNGATLSFSGSNISTIGTGTVILSGTNSYTGTTTINGGTLLLASTGQLTGGGTVNVNTGGYFGGTGNVAGPIAVASGGTLFTGNNGIGSLTAASSVTNTAGSTLQIKLQYPTGSTPVEGSDNDVIELTGAAAVFTPGGATLQLVPALNTFPSSFAPITYVIVDGGSSGLIDPNTTFANLANGATYFDGNSTYSVNYGTNEITLTLDSVSAPAPEPASIGLLSLGGCALLRRRRRLVHDG